MIWYVTVLKALAACLITNSHYEGIYPLSIFANGGLLGDVLFFSVSGFCLYNIPKKFLPWYGKRIFRIYPAVWMITILYLLLGFYDFSRGGGSGWMVFVSYRLSLCGIHYGLVCFLFCSQKMREAPGEHYKPNGRRHMQHLRYNHDPTVFSCGDGFTDDCLSIL